MDEFYFFVDELIKEAGSSDYYTRNRGKRLAYQKRYRSANRSKLALKAKQYRRKVRTGAIRKRRRQKVGHSYIYTGY